MAHGRGTYSRRFRILDVVVELPAGRLLHLSALNEFTVGTGGVRVYLETSPMARGKSEASSIVLKTK